jgi:hypothetical protein
MFPWECCLEFVFPFHLCHPKIVLLLILDFIERRIQAEWSTMRESSGYYSESSWSENKFLRRKREWDLLEADTWSSVTDFHSSRLLVKDWTVLLDSTSVTPVCDSQLCCFCFQSNRHWYFHLTSWTLLTLFVYLKDSDSMCLHSLLSPSCLKRQKIESFIHLFSPLTHDWNLISDASRTNWDQWTVIYAFPVTSRWNSFLWWHMTLSAIVIFSQHIFIDGGIVFTLPWHPSLQPKLHLILTVTAVGKSTLWGVEHLLWLLSFIFTWSCTAIEKYTTAVIMIPTTIFEGNSAFFCKTILLVKDPKDTWARLFSSFRKF